MLVFALGSNTTDSFILSRCDLKQAGSRELNIKVSTQRQPLVFPVHSHCKNEVDAIHQDYQYTPCPTILAGCWLEEWNELCENVDRNMEGLVSPAPESFHVLHSVVSNINSEITCLDGRSPEGTVAVSYLDDLKALSSFLVKPSYVIELYLDCGSLKWRLIPRARNTKCEVVYPCSFIQDSEAELHHKHNTLELSRMALDLATKTSSPHTLTKVHGITRQAEVCNSGVTPGSSLCSHICVSRPCLPLLQNILTAETPDTDNGFGFERPHIIRCMFQLCPCGCAMLL